MADDEALQRSRELLSPSDLICFLNKDVAQHVVDVKFFLPFQCCTDSPLRLSLLAEVALQDFCEVSLASLHPVR
jgi:hypothetical protein